MTNHELVSRLYAGSIVDTVPEPLLLLTDDLRVVMANASFCRFLGVPREELDGRSFHEVGGGEWDLPELRLLLEQMLPDHTELRDFELHAVSGRFGRRTVLLNARRLHHPDADGQLILLAFEDVTDRRRLELELQQVMIELERSNRELESFASIASHDLQEPLRKIRAFGERLEAVCEGQLPEKGRDFLARMTSAAARMQNLINDLLSLARLTTKGTVWAPVDLGAIVRDVKVDLEEAIAAAGGRVDAESLPTIVADPTLMRQLFQNLIGNALKFHGPEPPVVRIVADEVPAPVGPSAGAMPRVHRIVVSDNGIGFEQKYAERIFGAFERLHARDAFAGTGIGLALCRRIVQRHAGTIRAESEPGHGSRFIIHLPATQKDTH